MAGPWAGQKGGGSGWEISLDLDSPLVVVSGDEDYGPVLRVRGGRIVVERSGDVKDGQKFVADWSGCDACITLP